MNYLESTKLLKSLSHSAIESAKQLESLGFKGLTHFEQCERQHHLNIIKIYNDINSSLNHFKTHLKRG
jgi:hypothetical protein